MRKSLAVFLILSLMLSLVPAMAFAQGTDSQQVKVEQAIEIAKKYFEIPKEYDQFDSNYEQNQYSSVWVLNWTLQKGNGSINVRIDVKSGEVVGYGEYNPKYYEGNFSSIPKVSKAAGEKIALNFIKKVAPSKAGEVTLNPDRQNKYYYSSGPIFHSYNFSRTINGIEYPSNTISVTVNGQNGKVTSFNCNWEDLKVAPAKAVLSRQEAEKIFSEKIGFKLKYFKPGSDTKNAKPVKLIYQVENPAQMGIDAETGEVVRIDNYYPYYDLGSGGMFKEVTSQKLEPYEQSVKEEIEGLLTKEQALEKAQKAVPINSNYKLEYASLNRDWSFSELRIWSFNWSKQVKDNYGWANVEIDAKTGKVLAFSYTVDSNNNQSKRTIVKNKKAAEQILENYLKTNYPDLGNDWQLKEDYYLQAQDTENQPSYYLTLERIVDGVPFAQNFVSATIDSYTGKIFDFRLRHFNLDFPKKDSVLDKNKFTADFLAKYPMNLIYAKNQDNQLYLVYNLAPMESYTYDAVTGQMLNYNGEVIIDNKPIEIKDIQGHWASSYIQTLNDFGMLKLDNDLYKPDETITQSEIIKMLVKAKDGYIEDEKDGNWYETYYQQAKQSGLIKDAEVKPSALMTRQEFAKFLVRSLMNDKIATLNVYKFNQYKDANKIAKGYLGYGAIADGLGLLPGHGGNWKPKAQVKRGEACAVLIRYLQLEK
ncbi:PepSY domain-containing protein [Bacillota bacterium LX-D]|nr:PepSY domain-containing protein [Bacillota bacterium LX-D]